MRTDEAAAVQEMHDNLTAEIERLRAALIEVRAYLEDIDDYPEPGETIKIIDRALRD